MVVMLNVVRRRSDNRDGDKRGVPRTVARRAVTRRVVTRRAVTKRLCRNVHESMVAFTAYSQNTAEPTEPMTSS